MKKILSVIMLSLVALMGLVFVGCKDNKIDIDVYFHTSTADGEEYTLLSKNERVEITLNADDSDDMEYYIDIRVKITKGKVNISDKAILLNNTSDAIRVPASVDFDEDLQMATARVYINGGGAPILTIKSTEGGSVEVPINIEIPVTEIRQNPNYTPAVIAGDNTMNLDSSKLLSFYPNNSRRVTTQRGVTFTSNTPNVSVVNNKLVFGADYVPTDEISLTATSTSKSDVYTEVRIKVVDNLNDYAVNMCYANGNNIENVIDLYAKSDYSTVGVKLALETGTYVLPYSDDIAVSYSMDKKNIVSLASTGEYEYTIRALQKNTVNITFTFEYKGFDFAGKKPVVTKTIKVNVGELPSAMQINNISSDTLSYFVYDTYEGKDGLELYFRAIPLTSDAKIHLYFMSDGAKVTTAQGYTNALLVTKNGITMPYDINDGYELNNNDKLVLRLQDIDISSISTIEMQAELLITPNNFVGQEVTDKKYVTKKISLTPKKIYTNVELKQGDDTCNVYDTTLLAKGVDSAFSLDFSPNNIDIANTTITLKNGNVTLMDSNKIVKSSLTSDDLSPSIDINGKTVYSFYLKGDTLGDDTLTISNINGYTKSYALQVVNATKNPTVAYNVSDKSKTNVGYQSYDDTTGTYRLAIKSRASIDMYSVVDSTIKDISLQSKVSELSNGHSSDNIAVKAVSDGNDIRFSAQKEGTSIYELSIVTFGVSDTGVVSDLTITRTFEVAVYEPVSAFSLAVSDTTVYSRDSVGIYLRDRAKAEINVNFNQNTATNTVYFTSGSEDCYSIRVSVLGDAQVTGTKSDVYGYYLDLDGRKVTVAKESTGTVYVTLAVKQFDKSTSNTITQEINFVDATPANGITLSGTSLVKREGQYTMNFGDTTAVEKVFTATVSNADASFKDLMFKIYGKSGQEISNGSVVFVSYDADRKIYSVEPKNGGDAILQIMSVSNPDVRAQVYISVSDGETTPYQIYSVDDFKKIENSDKKFVIAQDLDFSGQSVKINVFRGTLDGDMSIWSLNADGSVTTTTIHSSISNIDLKNNDSLIAKNTGTIQNINFINVHYTGNIGSESQTVSSANIGLVGENQGTLSNVYVDFKADINTYLSANESQTVNIGALAGVNTGTISSTGKMCDSDITLTIRSTVANDTSIQNVGGIVGQNKGTLTGGYTYGDQNTEVTDLTTNATGIVKIAVTNRSALVQENSRVGGAVGFSNGNISGVSIITRSLSAGYDIGGIAGRVLSSGNDNNKDINECVVQNPNIIGTGTAQNIGGVVGYTTGNLYLTGVHFVQVYDETIGIKGAGLIGGIAGNANNAKMRYCYVENFITTPAISGSGYIGGIIGSANGTEINQSYANMDIYASDADTIVCGIIGKSDRCTVNNCYFIGNISDATGSKTIDNIYATGDTNVSTSYAVINSYGYIDMSQCSDMKDRSSYTDFKFSGEPDSIIWYIDDNLNDGYPYLLYYKDNTSGDMLTIVPNAMTAVINDRYVTKYDDQTAIVYYYEALNGTDATAKNKYKLINDDNNGIIDLTISPMNSNAQQYTLTVVEGNTIAYISDGYLVLKNAGATSHKVVVRITATYNSALSQYITLYVMQNYENFGIFTTADKLEKDQLINSKQLIIPTNSNRSLFVRFDNGDYVVGSGYQLKLTSESSTANVLTIDGMPITTGGVTLDMANVLDMSVLDFDALATSASGGYITYIINASVVYDYSQLDGSLTGDPYESETQTFKIVVKKQATALRVSTDEIVMASDGYESFDVALNTNFLSSNPVETASDKIISTSRLTTETQDEIRVSISAKDDATATWCDSLGVSRVEDLFNFYISADKVDGGITYSVDFELKNERDYRYITEELSFDIKITSLSNITLAETISLRIQPKVLSDILAYHYAEGEMGILGNDRVYVVKETSSNLIIPGGTGLLKIDLDPIYSHIDRVEITSSALSDGTRIAFEQMLLCENADKNKTYYVTNYPRPAVIENGLSLGLVSNSDKTYTGTLYVRTSLPSLLAVSEYFTVTLKGYIGDTLICENDIKLLTQYKPGVVVNVLDADEITIDGEQRYLIQTNSDTQLFTVEVYGYDYSGMPIIEVKDQSGTLLSDKVRTSLVSSEFTNRNSQLLTYKIETLGTLETNKLFDINITLSLFINGKNQSEQKSLSFVSTNAILRGVSLADGVIYDGEVTLAIGGNIPLALNWTTYSTNDLNSHINKILLDTIDKDQLIKLYSTQTTNTAGVQTKKDFSTYTSDTGIFTTKYIDAEKAYRLFAKSSVSKLSVNFTIYYRYEYSDGGVKLKFLATDSGQSECYRLSFDFALTIYADTTENTPIPVYTAENLKSMVAGQNYILMADITLTDWEPLDINTEGQSIASLDGNNKIITIHNFAPKRYDDSVLLSSANVGLFAQVYSNTLLKNITIDVSQLSDTDVTQFTTYNFGVLAGVNNGLIVNCDIINKYKEKKANIRIIGNETSDNGTNKVTSVVGGFVGVNYGNITNSRIGSYFVKIGTDGMPVSTTQSYPFTINAYGTVAGFVATNAGTISNCYSVNVGVTNLTSKENDSKTAGFVAENTKTIKYSYVKGTLSTISSLPDDNGIPQVRAKGVKVYSNSYSSSFVFSNAGEITDSFANINADTYSGTVAGFVYTNSGTITNAYTTANVDGNSTSKAPFVGVNVRNEFLNTGDIVSSYYLDMSTDSFAVDGDTARGISISGFNSTNVLNTFNIMDDANGIWTFNTSILDNGRFVSDSGLLPELTTANMISRSVRVLDEKNTTDDKNVYEYVGQYTLGKENNPYLIRNAEEFKAYMSSHDNSTVFTGYARLIDNITLSREYDVSKLTFSGSLEGNGFAISGIDISWTDEAKVDRSITSLGLFARLDGATFKNITLNIINVSGSQTNYVGGLAGVITDSVVVNVDVLGGNKIVGNNIVGGLAGLITGDSHIENITIGVSALAGYNSQNTSSDAKTITVGEKTVTYSNEYISEEDFATNAVKSAFGTHSEVFSGEASDYATYVSTLSYAGGLAGVLDLDGGTNLISNVKKIQVNTSTSSLSADNIVKVSADIAGGIAGYVGESTHLSRAQYIVNYDNTKQYITGRYAVGGIVGMHYGYISLSQIGYDTETQKTFDESVKDYLTTTGTDIPSIDLLRGEGFAGGFVGINLGGQISNSLTRVSVYHTAVDSITDDYDGAKVLGGFAGATLAGEYNSVFNSGAIYAGSEVISGGLIGLAIGSDANSALLRAFYTANRTVDEKTYAIKLNRTVAGGYVSQTADVSVYGRMLSCMGTGVDLIASVNNTGSAKPVDTYAVKQDNTASCPVVYNNTDKYNIADFHILDLIDIDRAVQPATFEQIFGEWSTIYWTLDNTYYYPLLLQLHYDDSYEIWTESDFDKIVEDPYATYIIRDDIVISGKRQYVVDEFYGKIIGEKLDGGVPTVSVNLSENVVNADGTGFFKQTEGADIKNINFVINVGKEKFEETATTGSVVAIDEGSTSLSNIFVSGSIESQNTNVGGLVGSGTDTIINNCQVYSNIIATNATTVGGIAGTLTKSDKGMVRNSIYNATLDVTSTGTTDIGGLVGKYTDGSVTETANTTITIDVTGNRNNTVNVGGLVGNADNVTIRSNEITPAITVQTAKSASVGGLIGSSTGDVTIDEKNIIHVGNITVQTVDTVNVGGAVGALSNASSADSKQGISHCYNYADISVSDVKEENNNIGTLVGKAHEANISSSMSYGTLVVTNVAKANVGMVGYAYTIAIQQSMSADEITANAGELYIGGLVGNAEKVTLQHNASVGKLFIEGEKSTSTSTPATTASTTTTTKCSTTVVTAGGLVGNADISITASYNYSATVIDVTRLAQTATDTIHALVGSKNSDNITNTYYISDIVTYTDSVGQNAYFGAFTAGFIGYQDDNDNFYWTRVDDQNPTNTLPYPIVLTDEIERAERGADACLTAYGNVLYPIVVTNDSSVLSDKTKDKTADGDYCYYYYNLTFDLTINDLETFNGVLMGHGHTIQTNGKHLFTYITAHSVVSDIKIDMGVSQTFSVDCNGIAYDGSLAKASAGTVFMCHVNAIDLTIAGNASGAYFGGLLGINVGRMYACGSTVEIKNMSNAHVSGLVYLNGTTNSTGSVTISALEYTDNKPFIDYSYFTGYITDTTDSSNRVGFVYESDDSAYIRNSYSAGVVVKSKIFAGSLSAGSDNCFDYYASLGKDEEKGEEGKEGNILAKKYTSDIYAFDNLWTNGNKSSATAICIYNYGYPIFDSKGLDVLDLCTGETGGKTDIDILISHLGVLAELVGNSSLYSVNNNPTTFRLVYDIDLSQVEDKDELVEKWVGIGTGTGTESDPFTAIFTTGTRKEVQSAQTAQSNQTVQSTQTTTSQTTQSAQTTSQSTYTTMTITGLVGSGLFGYVGAVGKKGSITNVHMHDITNIASTGGAIANIVTAGDISDCKVSGKITGKGALGGIVGSIVSGTISNCTISGQIEGKSTVGGIAGTAGNATIENNYFGTDGTIDKDPNELTITGTGNVGGVAGIVTGEVTISSNYAKSETTGLTVDIKYGGGATVGGIVGKVNASGNATIEYNGSKDLDSPTTTEPTNVVTYAFACSKSGETANYLGGAVGNNAGTITVYSNLITLGTMDARVIGGVVAKSARGHVYSNTITGGGNLSNVAIFGGVIGYLDGGTTIGTDDTDNNTKLNNKGEAKFTFSSVSVNGAEIKDEDEKAIGTFKGYGGIVGVMTGGTVFSHKLGGALQTNSYTQNFTSLENVGGLVGYMTDGSIGEDALTDSDIITVQGYKNVGGVVGHYEGKIKADIKLKEVYNDDTTNGTTDETEQIAKVFGVENVGGIFGQYHVECEVASEKDKEHYSLSYFTNKNTLHSYNWYSEGYTNAGGIAGYISAVLQINDCYNYATLGSEEDAGTGNPVGYFDYIGGITGKLDDKNTITLVEEKDDQGEPTGEWTIQTGTATLSNLYNYGSIYGNDYVGGIIGYSTSALSTTATTTESKICCDSAGGDAPTIISGQKYVGGIIGYSTADVTGDGNSITNNATVQATYNAGGILGYSTGNISNVTNTGAVEYLEIDKIHELDADEIASFGFGGIVGQWIATGKTISTVTNTGTVSGFINVGGIVGQTVLKSGENSITGSSNTGSSNKGDITGYYNVGGIVGKVSLITDTTNEDEITLSITTTTNKGKVTGKFDDTYKFGSTNIGGIVGYLGCTTRTVYNLGSISDNKYTLTNEGTVSGYYNVGGIVGYVYARAEDSVGTVEIKASNTGEVTVTDTIVEPTYYLSTTIKQYDKKSTAGTGTIFSAENFGVGGIIGATDAVLTSLSVENTGAVDAPLSTNVGGIIGLQRLGRAGTTNSSTSVDSTTITLDNTTGEYNTTITANVTGQTNVGGTIGYVNDEYEHRKRTITSTSTSTSTGSNGGGGGTSRSVRTTAVESLSTISIGTTTTTTGHTITGTTNVGGVIGKAKVNNITGKSADTAILSSTTVTGINDSSSVGGVIGYMEGNLSNAEEAGKTDNINNWDMVSNIKSEATVSFSTTETDGKATTENSGGVVGTVKDATVSNLTAKIQNPQNRVIAYDTDKDGNLKLDDDNNPIPKTTIETTKDGYGVVVGRLKITDKYNIKDATVNLTAGNGDKSITRLVNYSKYYIGKLNASSFTSTDDEDRYYLIDNIENKNYLDAFYTSDGTYAMVLDREINKFNTFVSYTNLDDIYYNDGLNLTGVIRCIYRAVTDSTNKEKRIKVYNDYWRTDNNKYDGTESVTNPFNYSKEQALVKMSSGEKWANVGVAAGYFAAVVIDNIIAPGALLGDALALAWLAVAGRWVSYTITANIGLRHTFNSVATYNQGLNYFTGEINNYDNLGDINGINKVYKLHSFSDEDTYTYDVGDKTHYYSYLSAQANNALTTWNTVVKKNNGKYSKTENDEFTDYGVIPYGVHEYKFNKIDCEGYTDSNDQLSYTYVKNTNSVAKGSEYTDISETIRGTNKSGSEISITVNPYIVLDITDDGYALLGREMIEYKYIEVYTIMNKNLAVNDKYTYGDEQYTVVQVNDIKDDKGNVTNKYVLLGKSLDVNTDDMHALDDDYMPKYYKYISMDISSTDDIETIKKIYEPYEPESGDIKTVYYQYDKSGTRSIYVYTKLNTLNIDNALVYDDVDVSGYNNIDSGDTILKYKDGKYEILKENIDIMDTTLNDSIKNEIANGYSIIVIDHVPELVDGLILSQGQVITISDDTSKSAVDKAKAELIYTNGFYTALYYSSDNVHVYNSKGTKSTGTFDMAKILKDLDINTSTSYVTLNEELSYIHHIDKTSS